MRVICTHTVVSREQKFNLSIWRVTSSKLFLPIVVLLTVVARVLISREPDMILRYRRNQLLRAAKLRRFRTKLVTTKLARQMSLQRRLMCLLADRETNRPARIIHRYSLRFYLYWLQTTVAVIHRKFFNARYFNNVSFRILKKH